MKIVCDNCSAKYSIADEKVAGRVFKIRCKKCDSAIVVRGDQLDGGGEEESTRVVDYGGDAVWHVVIEGDQQGPFAPSQIGEMLAAGTIGWDAYVWMEGFDDWKPAQDVEELVSAVMGGEQAGAAEAAPADMGGSAPMGADPFAATQHSASAHPGDDDPFGAQRDAGADLFAQAESASPFGGGAEEEESDVVASPVAPRARAEQSLTGARNENSVLFSLSNLQALATGGNGGAGPAASSSSAMSAGPASPQAAPGMASGEGSGLIDIRALASATGVSGAGGGAAVTPAARQDRVDDLLSIGGGAGGLGSSLGAPVLIPEKKEESSNKGVIIAAVGVAAVAIAAAAAVVIVVVMNQPEAGTETDIGASAAVTGGPETVEPTTATETPSTDTGETSATGAAPPAETETAAAPSEESEGDGEAETASNDTPGAPRRGRHHGRTPRGNDPTPSPQQAAAPPPPSRDRGGDRSIDDLLGDALNEGGNSRRRPPSRGREPAGNASGPQSPGRSDVMSAMGSVQGAVSACGNGSHGTAAVRVVFTGSNGRVASADVSGNFPGPVKTCISRAVRGARVPPFRQDRFTVNYPFRL